MIAGALVSAKRGENTEGEDRHGRHHSQDNDSRSVMRFPRYRIQHTSKRRSKHTAASLARAARLILGEHMA